MLHKKHADGNDFSPVWQLNESGIVVWPIGAFEQHGHHLPLNTDNIQAEYHAEMVAEELGACLLPLLPFGNSLEHAGFRGTLTVSPKLLTDLVREFAIEMEKQNFNRLIILNAHGGNFALGPAVRHFNREDHALKILLVNAWEFWNSKFKTPEIHSGSAETSLMLAINKDLVGDDRRDGDPFKMNPPYKQFDLNHFGVGRMNRNGVWGYPSKASEKAGKQMLESVKKNMVPYIKERLKKFDTDPRYGGAGPVALRPMGPGDLQLGMNLKKMANWNQLEADWKLLMACPGFAGWVAFHNGKGSGSITVVPYGNKFAWIGMVLVDPAARGRGLGKDLLKKAIDSFSRKMPLRLDATEEGKKIYDKLKFKEDFRLSRMQNFNVKKLSLKSSKGLRKGKAADLEALAFWDAEIFAAKRPAILKGLSIMGKKCFWVFEKSGKICGYVMGRPGSRYYQIGPILAEDSQTAGLLLKAALSQLAGEELIIDVLDSQKEFKKVLISLGFELQRHFIRMTRGKIKTRPVVKKQFAITGPEFG